MTVLAFDKIGAVVSGSVLTKIDGESANQDINNKDTKMTDTTTKAFDTISAAMMLRGGVNAARAKTLSSLLARNGIELNASGKIGVPEFDAALSKTGMTIDDRMQLKSELRNLGLLHRAY